MLDRQVLQIQPELELNERVRPFSSHRVTANLVVLGDPGAGKTELFRQLARAADGHFITVRNFLNTPAEALPCDKSLWLDGLDETRGGRGDRGAIDRLVQKLHVVRPRALRLSCRVADWLGTSDLSALASYFDLCGGAPVVVQLQPLGRDEQWQILSAHGRSDPGGFLDDAQHRGLDGMLSNPQTLLMLHLAVQDAAWPTTRESLFEKATTLLLREPNVEHNERADVVHQQTLASVTDAAGALCALRLVSDCAGFSLQPEGTDEMPGWREIPLAEPAAIQAALRRRAFASAVEPDVADYLHRTIAEYLGAGWIAGKIAAGLPLGRVQALLGVDGQPASSLRGLHAWLAVRSPESAPALIDADPMGIVMYADAARLPPGDKRRLLSALWRTAERDPWFYHGAYAAYGVGALSDPAMADTFRDLLSTADTPFSLRKLIVDAVAMGAPMPALREDLHALLVDLQQPFALRDGALDALIAMDDAGRSAVASAYPDLGEDESGLRLRCIALRTLYGKGLGMDHVLAHVEAVATRAGGKYISALYRVDDAIPDSDLPALLDAIALALKLPEECGNDDALHDVALFYESLISREIRLNPQQEGARLYGWLDMLRRLPGEILRSGPLERAAKDSTGIPASIIDAWIKNSESDEDLAYGWSSYRRKFGRILDDDCIFACFYAELTAGEKRKEKFLYRHLFLLCYWNADDFIERFWRIHAHGDVLLELASVREEMCVSHIDLETLRWEHRRVRRERERHHQKADAMASFDRDGDDISRGSHIGWLDVIGGLYFSRFSECDSEKSPEERLVEYLGASRTLIACSGLRSLVAQGTAPAALEIISLHLDGNYFSWWYAVLAGLDRLSEIEFRQAGFGHDYLASAVVLSALVPAYQKIDGTMRRWRYRWLDELKKVQPELVVRTYAMILEAELSAGKPHSACLDALNDPALTGRLRGESVETLLSRFPWMADSILWELLAMAGHDGMWPALSVITDEVARSVVAFETAEEVAAKRATREVWIAFGFLTEPDRYTKDIEAMHGEEAEEMVWALARVGSIDSHPGVRFSEFSIDQLEFVIAFTAGMYPRAEHPSGTTIGSRHPWNASEIVANALSALSASTDDAAHTALQRLAVHPALESYASQVRHLLAQQRMRRIDAAHALPDWRSAAQTLLNRAPATAQDLHALVRHHVEAIRQQIAHDNADAYKRFWNENAHGRVTSPKSENSARDVLIELLRPRLQPLGLRAEPEGDMARDRRADIVVFGRDIKCPIELKRDHHPDVWTAAEHQLDRFYARDPQASGFGLYGVFWYGEARDRSVTSPPTGIARPRSADEMQESLCRLLPEHLQAKIAIVVIDVSGQLPAT